MRVDQISNWQAIAFALGIVAVAWLIWRLVPGTHGPRRADVFSKAETTAYDADLPKYFIAATLALLLGGAHTVVKNVPGFWLWLWQAGYGGHLFRDLANSHIIIVGGGTVLLTALTWYTLPRFANRPLYSTSLAGASFWLTVIGVFGFYTAWLILGLVEGQMVRQGWTYLAAKEALGKWHSVPTALSSSVMGLGYWTYVLNVALTAFAARRVKEKPLGHLLPFSVVSAGALFVGTVQGVIQVMPANADWIRAAGKFGEYVDPISHAHINLVTGMMVSLAALFIYFGPRLGSRRVPRRVAHLVFWTLVGGSLFFYLTFLGLGLILGRAVNGYGGINAPTLVPFLSQWRGRLLALSGTAMLAGFWLYFGLLWRYLDLRTLGRHLRQATPAAFWLVSSLALLIGTGQGLLQALPATAPLLTHAEEIPNIHAQLNMIGGVMLALIGTVYLLLPELLGTQPQRRLAQLSLYGIGGGIGTYYLVTLVAGLWRLSYMRQGLDGVTAATQLRGLAPLLLLATALPMLLGYVGFGAAIWQCTPHYRRAWLRALRTSAQRYNGPQPAWMRHIPYRNLLAAEVVSAFFGFPGLGWVLAGQPVPGIPLLLVGPAVAWAVIPVLISPYGEGLLASSGLGTLFAYLLLSTTLSFAGLWLVLRRQRGTSIDGTL